MKTWTSWQDALVWCWDNASETCVVLASDWDEQVPGKVAKLKYDAFMRCFFRHP